MPTFQDPVADSDEATQALRGLAHATRAFDDPADTYAVIGELLSGVRSLRQVLHQLAAAHITHHDRAHTDDGNPQVGTRAALAAADELQQASILIDAVEAHLDHASQHSGRIAWHPEPAPIREERPSRWIGVVFLQGEEADEVLALIDRDGTDAAIEHLAGFDVGEETTQAALVNGYVYDHVPAGALDQITTGKDYTLTYNHELGHISLLRTHLSATPEMESDAQPQCAAASRATPHRPARTQEADDDQWRLSRSPSASRGRSL
ncbi:hypothetical protein GCM10009563_08890 [Subtercola frigoramans]